MISIYAPPYSQATLGILLTCMAGCIAGNAKLPAAAALYKKHGFALAEERPAVVPFDKPVVEQRYELQAN